MAENKNYFHNIDLIRNKLMNPLLNPMSTSQRNSLALTPTDAGYAYFDITLNQLYFWDGYNWIGSSGGGATGWDDMLAQNQMQSADRIADSNGHKLSFINADTIDLQTVNGFGNLTNNTWQINNDGSGHFGNYLTPNNGFSFHSTGTFLVDGVNYFDAGLLNIDFPNAIVQIGDFQNFVNGTGYSIDDAAQTQSFNAANGFNFTGSNIDIDNYKITSLADGTDPTDAINLSQLTSYISGYVPYTGATTNVDLNPYNITASQFIVWGGLGNGFLKDDGSIDTNVYLTITSAASTYEPIITSGTTSQYWRGDKTWQTLPIYTLSGLGGVPTTRTLTINGTSYDLSTDRTWSVGDLLSSGSYANPSWITSLAYSKLTGAPTLGTWSSINYPTWVSGTPFIKMTASGTFALDNNTYLTSAVTSVGAISPITSSGGNTPTISTSMATNKLIGRSSSGVGVMEEISIGTGLSLSGGTLTNTISLSGYVPYSSYGTNNVSANNFFYGFTSVVASGTQIVLTVNSTPSYLITGSGGQTIKLPDATTLPNGTVFQFNNNQSSGAISVNNNSNTLVKSVPSGGYLTLILTDNTTITGLWDSHFEIPTNASWSTNTLDWAGSITNATWNGNVVAINRGGTGSSTQNFVDLTTNQTIAGAKTFSTAPVLSSLVASQILATDASKNIQTLDVATYPSLVELAYVKGVTSSIQTQFSGKQPLNTNLTNIGVVSPSTGYLYYNGSSFSYATPTSTNLYNADGTLTSNRTISAGSGPYTLTINPATTFNGNPLTISGNQTAAAWGLNGIGLKSIAATYTDNTSTSGTVTNAAFHVLGTPTITTSTGSVTYSNLYSLYIKAPATSGTTVATNKYSLGLEGGLYTGGLSWLAGGILIQGSSCSIYPMINAYGGLQATGGISSVANYATNPSGVPTPSSNNQITLTSFGWNGSNGYTNLTGYQLRNVPNSNNNQDADLVLYNYGSSYANTEYLRIKQGGSLLIGTPTDITSSIFTVASTSKGALLPRGTNANRTSITSPATGLLFYCTDATEGMYINKSGGWDMFGTLGATQTWSGVNTFTTNLTFTPTNSTINVQSPTSSGSGNNLTIQAGTAFSNGAGGTLNLYQGAGVGGPGVGSVNIGLTTGPLSNPALIKLNGGTRVTSGGGYVGTMFAVNNTSSDMLSFYYDQVNSIVANIYFSSWQGQFTSANSYVFDNNVGIGQLTNPAAPTLTPSATGGTLTAATYYYKIVAVDVNGKTTGNGTEANTTTTGTTSSVGLTWTAIIGAYSYRIYQGTVTNTQTKYFTSTTNSATDIGSGYTVTAIPNVSANTSAKSWISGSGLVIPSLTTTNINAWSNPITGQGVYDNTLNLNKFYNSTAWDTLGSLAATQTWTGVNTFNSASGLVIGASTTIYFGSAGFGSYISSNGYGMSYATKDNVGNSQHSFYLGAKQVAQFGNTYNTASSQSEFYVANHTSGTKLFSVQSGGNTLVGYSSDASDDGVNKLQVNGSAKFQGTVQLKGYTVSTLPSGIQGMTAFVTDSLTPVFGSTVVGGGAVPMKVWYDGTSWKVG